MKLMIAYWRDNRLPILLLAIPIFSITAWVNLSVFVDNKGWFPPFVAGEDFNGNTSLGGEPLYIAKSLRSGEGFLSSPFGEPTGPTAWIAPVYPSVIAGLLWLVGTQSRAALVVLILKNLVLVFTGLVVYETSRRTCPRFTPLAAIAVFYLLISSRFQFFFQMTSDIWINLVVLDVFVLVAPRLWRERLPLSTLVLSGVVAAIGVLTNPSLGLAWVALCGIGFLKVRDVRILLIALGICVAAAGLWSIRNHAQLGRWIPVKSNLYYEAYKTNYESDGLLTEEFFAGHPLHNQAARSEYKLASEVAFLDGFKERFNVALREDPGRFLAGLGRRVLAATMVYVPYSRAYDQGAEWWFKLIYPLPFIGLILALMRRARPQPMLIIALVTTATFLLPYVAVSYYGRYEAPIIVCKALFMLCGANAILAFIARNSSNPAGGSLAS